jgi:Recombination endonuclease VII
MPYKNKVKNDACKKAWRAANPERMTAARKAWAKKHPQKRQKGDWIEETHGISAEEYYAKLARQENVCAVCLQPFDSTNRMTMPVLDHNHETGEHRDFVHNCCNLGIGFLQDNPDICELAAAYLKRHSEGSYA